MSSRRRERRGNRMRKRALKKGRYPNPFNSHPPRSSKLRGRNKRMALLSRQVKVLKGSSIWNPAFVLSTGDPVTFEATLWNAQKGRSGIVSECLE